MTTLALRSRSALGPAVAGAFLRGPLLAWAALFLNVMPFQGSSVLLIPHSLGQLLAQGALIAALVLALLANPAMAIRPNVFLAILTTMSVIAFAVSIHNEFVIGATYRAIRLMLFVLVLWMLTPWWGRPDLSLLRAHLSVLKVIIASVWVGAVLAPGAAFSTEGRLAGMVWPIPPPQVAHYAAVLMGATVVLWFCGLVAGRGTAITLIAAGAALVATHTRTALLALVLGLVVAGASLFVGTARVRRTAAVAVVAGLATWIVFSPLIVSWLARGQSSQDLSQLTGRTKVWAMLAQRHTTTLQEIFGTGLGNKSFNGLPIDSNWVATNLELGRVGVALAVAFLIFLLLAALARPAGPRRAIAVFLVVYCMAASFTETGLGDASPYLLDLVVAASVAAGPPGWRRRSLSGRGPSQAPRSASM